MIRRRLAPIWAWSCALALIGFGLTPAPASAVAPIHHVFVIVLENESASTTFGPGSPAPYLSGTLRSDGAYLPDYHGIGHESNDNYIAMISGQAPNPQTQADCQFFTPFVPGTVGGNGQALGSGCVYPADVPTIAGQLLAKGLTWRDYDEDMGANPTREAAECAHPGLGASDNTQKATATDQYATRHNPFVYFHSVIDDTTLCDTHVVNLDLLTRDLAAASNTPNYSFIVPDLCDDGHDAPCANGQAGGLAQADGFLRQWVPRITSSPAFRQDGGLLMITFDEAATSDSSSCCGEIPGPGSPLPGITGLGGGDVGAVLLSPCIEPGTVSMLPYNHYTMLRSVEDIFGLTHIGYAGLSGETSFGSDIFNRSCRPPPVADVRAPAVASSAAAAPHIPVRWSANEATSRFTVQVRQTSGHTHAWRTLLSASSRRSLTYGGALGRTYEFRVTAIDGSGDGGNPATTSTITPSGVHITGGRYGGAWRVEKVHGAWNGHAIVGSSGASLTLHYRGGKIAVVGERGRQAARVRVDLDGHSRTFGLRSSQLLVRQIVYRAGADLGPHAFTLHVLSGSAAIEGVAVADRMN